MPDAEVAAIRLRPIFILVAAHTPEFCGGVRLLSGLANRAKRFPDEPSGALGIQGALLGTVGTYVAHIGRLGDNSLKRGILSLSHVPWDELLLVLPGIPTIAAATGWLLADRQEPGVARRAIR